MNKIVHVGPVTLTLDADNNITISAPSEYDDSKNVETMLTAEPIGDRLWALRKLAEAVIARELTFLNGAEQPPVLDLCPFGTVSATVVRIPHDFTGGLVKYLGGIRQQRWLFKDGVVARIEMDAEHLEDVQPEAPRITMPEPTPMKATDFVPGWIYYSAQHGYCTFMGLVGDYGDLLYMDFRGRTRIRLAPEEVGRYFFREGQ